MLPLRETITPSAGQSFAWLTFDLQAFPYRWHFHPEFELTLITSGRGQRFVGNSIERFEPGDLVLLGPHLPHTWESAADPDERSRAVVIQFARQRLAAADSAQPEFSDIQRLLTAANRGLVFKLGAHHVVRSLIETGEALPPLDRLLRLLEVLQQLATCGRERPVADEAFCQQPRARDADRIDRICRKILEDLDSPPSLSEAATLAGMSPTGFSRFFRRMTGRTFTGWIHEVQIAQACHLLTRTDQPVTSIAAAAGFENLSHFNRIFKRLRGCTPREFRRGGAAAFPT